MGILSDLEAALPTPIGPRCGVSLAMAAHPDLADDIEAAVRRTDRSCRIIRDVLANHDVIVRLSSIERHRRGECLCRR